LGSSIPEGSINQAFQESPIPILSVDAALAAFARVLTDWVYRAIVFDVIVATDYRGRGLGATLVEHITTHPRLAQVECIQLFCTPDMQPFYQKYGFSQAEQLLMVRPR